MSEGVYMKYKIEKSDGSEVDPDACYFVLRLDTDEVARKAMRVYASHVDNYALGSEIINCLDQLDRAPCGCREAICPHTPIMDWVWRHGGTDNEQLNPND